MPTTTIKDLFPDKWLTPQHLQGKRVQATISAVTVEQLFQSQTNEKEPKLVLAFEGKTLRLPLNKTQAIAIAEITGTETFGEWTGTAIQMTPATARNKKLTIRIEAVPKPKATQPALAVDDQPDEDPFMLDNIHPKEQL